MKAVLYESSSGTGLAMSTNRIAARIAIVIVAVFSNGLLVGCEASLESGPPDEELTLTESTLMNHPASVPAEFIPTPHGWFHPSCVIEVGDDEEVRADGTISRVGGGSRALAKCAYPRYDRRGRIVATNAKEGSSTVDSNTNGGSQPAPPPPQVNGWVAFGQNTSMGPLAWISATWTVPRSPTTKSSQVLYYFPGFEPLATGDTILQPVLGYFGSSGSWQIASWNCCRNGNALHSTWIGASPGQSIYGYVSGTNCNSSLCTSWKVRTANRSTGTSTTLITDSYGESLDWAFGGVLEAYYVDSCSQYSASETLSFNNISVKRYNNGLIDVFPAWTPSVLATSPSCSAAVVSPGSGSITISTSAGCGSTCTQCVLNHRTDILPFYQNNGWDTSCNTRNAIVNNWCAIDPAGCVAIKSSSTCRGSCIPTGSCGNVCTACVLQQRTDILPFYQMNGWDTSCSNRNAIVDNWCTIDPNGCATVKTGSACGSYCGL